MVGTLRFSHHPPASHTLPRRGKSAEYFPQKHGIGVFRGTPRRHAFAAKNPALPQEKLRGFRLPSVCRKTSASS
jgi:hypothetical protein